MKAKHIYACPILSVLCRIINCQIFGLLLPRCTSTLLDSFCLVLLLAFCNLVNLIVVVQIVIDVMKEIHSDNADYKVIELS